MSNSVRHRWHFFRAGGFDQVRLETGADLMSLDELDQKLWVALACPVAGLEFDQRTLELIDADKDGRIRAPDIIGAGKWAGGLLKNPDDLLAGRAGLAAAAVNDATDEGKAIVASMRQIGMSLNKAEGDVITVEEVSDTGKIFAGTPFNGDGVITVDAGGDEGMKKIGEELMGVIGVERKVDRSGKPGFGQKEADDYFGALRAYVAWYERAGGATGVMVLGDKTGAAADAVRAVRVKVDDYFARCRLAAFDDRARAAMNRSAEDFAAVAGKDLSATDAAVAAFPLARVEVGCALPLGDKVNPAWVGAVREFKEKALAPLLNGGGIGGGREDLTEAEWEKVKESLAAYEAWRGSSPASAAVEKIGIERAREILASEAEEKFRALIAKDEAVRPQVEAISAVEKLVRLHRDLYRLMNNFVAFRDFYGRKQKAIFQAGTLFLDQRACEMCVRVQDAGRHALMAHLSRMYLAYCDVTNKATGQKMEIAASFSGGDSDNLMVGRNGIFYDRLGRDWDATITKIVENPISVRQAFWAPYKRALRWIEDQIAKRAAAADAAADARLQAAATAYEKATTDTGAPAGAAVPVAPAPLAPAPAKKIDVGVIAAIAVAFAGASAALGAILQAFFGLGMWMPLGIVALMLAISGPSMIIAFLKLRQRNLGPLLDANGWAVNAKAKINLPFGKALTSVAALPAGSTRDWKDPYAESHKGRTWTIIVLVLMALLTGCWYFGLIERAWPGLLPQSGYVKRQNAAATQAGVEGSRWWSGRR